MPFGLVKVLNPYAYAFLNQSLDLELLFLCIIRVLYVIFLFISE